MFYKENNTKTLLLSSLVSIWGILLTYNFYRKGGYDWNNEDYRWVYVKKKINNKCLWELFNLLFIHIFQNIVVFVLVMPVYQARFQPKVNIFDYVISGFIIFFLLVRTVADQQQWDFHVEKYKLIQENKPHKNFLQTGLFKFSRHPNFFAEQSIWISFYLFSIISSKCWINFDILGPIVLCLIFQGSTTLTEEITLGKYPEYADYQKNVSRLIPLPSNIEDYIKDD